jgi:serine/threonine-protein kinase
LNSDIQIFEAEDAWVDIDHGSWQRLSPLLDEALDLPAERRTQWLAELRRRDPELADEVEALLDEARAVGDERFLEHTPEAPERATLAGQTIGAYTLEAPLGHGGMGSVWLARRSDGRYEGKVAIKFLNAALVGRTGEERFRREGSILARLAHPNIARLIDAGVSATGQPYLVLELVDGERIDQYCDDQRFDVAARLKLFLDVLAAVAHAHAHLVVHRDLKPSNVLVTNDGTVKLLDFGIAKLLQDELHPSEATELTREAGRAMTPEYAAPEQLLGLPITTATDVYALGVLLYVLLGGQHPAGGGTHSSVELIKAIVETSPARLSEAVTSAKTLDAQALQDNAAKRAATPERLAGVLRGDLDNIVGKALKKNPAERYASVTAFADDIRSYLDHEPVSARADSLAYRTAKFVRRNRIPVALASLAALALLAGLAGTITQAQRATAQAQVAEAERSRADEQARVATKQRDFALRELSRAASVNEFNTFLLSDAAPSGKPFTAGELLARAEALVQRQPAGADVNRTDMLMSIGRQYRIMDHENDALRLLTQAYDVSRTQADLTTHARAACYLAAALSRGGSGGGERAEALFREGMSLLPDEPQYALDRIQCLQDGTIVANESYRAEEGLARARQAQAILPQLLYRSAALEVSVLMDLAESSRIAGRYGPAIAAFEQAYARTIELGRENTENAGTMYNNWALVLADTGQTLQAEALFRRAMRISSADGTEKNVSPMELSNLATILIELGRIDEAQRYADKAYERARAEGDEVIARFALGARGRVFRARGQYAQGMQTLSELERQFHRAYPPECGCFGTIASERGLLAAAHGDRERAIAEMDKAIAIAEGDKRRPDVLPRILTRRAEIQLALGRPAAALADAERSIRVNVDVTTPNGHSSILGLAYLVEGRALLASGPSLDAAQALTSAVEHLRPTLGLDHAQTRLAERLLTQAGAGKHS